MQEQLRSIEQRGLLASEQRAAEQRRVDTLLAATDQGIVRRMSGAAAAAPEDSMRRERLQRVLSRLNRLHGNSSGGGNDGAATATAAPSLSSYGENAPNHNSLYDWSPTSLAELEDANEEVELETIRRELRRQLPNHHPEVLRVMAESVRADMQRSGTASSARFANTQHESAPPRTEQSLRSQAILQAVRRHPRISARSREYMQRYIADRADRGERSSSSGTMALRGGGEDARDRYSASNDRYPWNRRPTYESSGDDSRSRLRRSMLADPPSNSSDAPTDVLKRAVVYLGNLRQSQSYKDSLGYAVDARFVTTEFFEERHDDFVLDLNSLQPVYPTSLLSRGSKFKGCQRANPDLSTRTNTARRRFSRDISGWDTYHGTSSQEYLPRLTLDDPTRPPSSSSIPPHAQRASTHARYPHPDQWPVEVTIHDVDWDRLTLSATMEAQNVPSHAPFTLDAHRSTTRLWTPTPRAETPDSFPDLLNPDGSLHIEPRIATPPPQLPPLSALGGGEKREQPASKTITTYLEGEILDFRHHTLLTESFPSNPATDATYWRKLPPFRDFSDSELCQRLLSRSFLNSLSHEYILMRWKEKCFVDKAEEEGEGCGLTISGFYYVCVRRGDGRVEGLYCDPQSSPYQHLVLERSERESAFWGWEFK